MQFRTYLIYHSESQIQYVMLRRIFTRRHDYGYIIMMIKVNISDKLIAPILTKTISMNTNNGSDSESPFNP